MNIQLPPLLQPGDTIALCATARFAEPEHLESARRHIEAAGFRCFVDPAIAVQHDQVAGTLSERVATFNRLLHDPGLKALWNVRGGYGSAEIVDLVDWDYFREHPKWLVGFSDFTTFLCHGQSQGVATLHAPMPVTFDRTVAGCLEATFHTLTSGEQHAKKWLPQQWSGRVVAGNLSVVYSILGTPSLPHLDGAILVLEDLDEYHYHLDRMLLSMRRRGAFNSLVGVVLGEFSDIHDHAIAWGPSVAETLEKHFSALGVPVVQRTCIGHGAENWPVLLTTC